MPPQAAVYLNANYSISATWITIGTLVILATLLLRVDKISVHLTRGILERESGMMPQIHGRLAGYVIGFFAVLSACSDAQQVADPSFKPKIEKPAFTSGKGPVVLLDEAHYNFHTASGRYQPFADLLRRDGYVVVGSRTCSAMKL